MGIKEKSPISEAEKHIKGNDLTQLPTEKIVRISLSDHLNRITGNYSTHRILYNPLNDTYRVATMCSYRNKVEIILGAGSLAECNLKMRLLWRVG